MLGACLVIWVLRRPQQLVRPYVWAEENVILSRFLDSGWEAAIKPVQGYLILPVSMLATLGAAISFRDLPALTYAFATLIFVVTVLLLLVPESAWGSFTTRAAMAVTMALFPCDPETVGVLLYGFWWATLWPVIILGWRSFHWPARAPCLAAAALSSPAGGALFLPFLVRYARSRRRDDLISAGLLAAGFALQVGLVVTSSRGSRVSANPRLVPVVLQVLRTGGFFELGWLKPTSPNTVLLAWVGLALLAFIAIGMLGLTAGLIE